MFTDNPVTPVRLEILIDVLRAHPRGMSANELCRLLQPLPLNPDLGSGSPALTSLRAASELGLVDSIEESKKITLSARCCKLKDTRKAILEAFDSRVLSNTETELYFALFYAYFLGLGKHAYERHSQNSQQWADQFNQDVFDGAPQTNPFNGTKLTGLNRWYGYVGLGWRDASGDFQANPYDRLMRALRPIFGRLRKLDADQFMTELGANCPELDGGELFIKANRHWDSADKQCSLGLSHALIELHLDKIVQLDCPADSTGWNLGEAEPPRDSSFHSDRLASIELLSD